MKQNSVHKTGFTIAKMSVFIEKRERPNAVFLVARKIFESSEMAHSAEVDVNMRWRLYNVRLSRYVTFLWARTACMTSHIL